MRTNNPRTRTLRSAVQTRAAYLVLAFGLLLSAAAHSIGFGEMEVESYLNQPFLAKVTVMGGDEADNLSVALGGPAAYQRLGLRPPRNLSAFSADVELERGEVVVRLTSRVPVTDLVVDLVLILQADGSEQIRHYPVLIDFAPEVRTAGAQPSRQAAPTLVQPRAADTSTVSSGKTYGPVRSGDTLGAIANLIRGNQRVNRRALMQAIVDLNPDAFINGDMNRLRAGVTLEIPALEGLDVITIDRTPFVERGSRQSAPTQPASRPPVQAVAERPVSAEPGRRAPTVKDSRLEIIGTPTSTQIVDSLNRWVEEDDATLVASASSARRDLAFATAEIQTYTQENERLRERVRELEDRVGSLRRLISLRAEEAAAAAGRPIAQETPAPAAESAAPASGTSFRAPEGEASVDPAALEVAADLPPPSPATSGSIFRKWWLWALVAAALLTMTGLAWLRGRREDQRRQEKTADLVNKIRQAAERNNPL